jgi:hypothetical protein
VPVLDLKECNDVLMDFDDLKVYKALLLLLSLVVPAITATIISSASKHCCHQRYLLTPLNSLLPLLLPAVTLYREH